MILDLYMCLLFLTRAVTDGILIGILPSVTSCMMRAALILHDWYLKSLLRSADVLPHARSVCVLRIYLYVHTGFHTVDLSMYLSFSELLKCDISLWFVDVVHCIFYCKFVISLFIVSSTASSSYRCSTY